MNCQRKVLLIRAQRVDDELVRQLDDAMTNVLCIPITRIEEIERDERIKTNILDFDHFDIAIFVSVHAARIGLSLLEEYWPMLPRHMVFFAIGAQTAECVSHHNLEVISPSTETTEGLLSLHGLKDVRSKRIVIFRGQGGREKLACELAKRGAQVTYSELYRRVTDEQNLKNALMVLPSIDCLVAHSAASLKLLGPPSRLIASNLRVVVPSDRVGGYAADMGYRLLNVAKGAAPHSVCEAVMSALTETTATTQFF
ncbi:MAG: hypothetical protein CMK36_01600 [Porticoccaceae bacterium]|nr:hypothetical protein [Porticoccaceae bacterium]